MGAVRASVGAVRASVGAVRASVGAGRASDGGIGSSKEGTGSSKEGLGSSEALEGISKRALEVVVCFGLLSVFLFELSRPVQPWLYRNSRLIVSFIFWSLYFLNDWLRTCSNGGNSLKIE